MGRTLRLAMTAALLPLSIAAQSEAAEAPKRKPGLWQQTLSAPGMPTQTMSMCTDAKTDDLVAARANEAQNCEKQSLRWEGGAFVVDAVCRGGGSTIRTRGRFTGDFGTQYAGELRSTFEPPLHGMKEMNQKIEARWIGPCRPGQKPGDVALDGMGGMNLNEMMQADPRKAKEMMQQMQQMQRMQEKPK
jgi:hypothetical protein